MKHLSFYFILFLLSIGFVMLIQSCKEKNEEYPVPQWSEYFYRTSTIEPRDISSILYENDHSVWLGAKGKEGLLHQDGYKWNVYNKDNTGIDFDSITSIIRDGNGHVWIGWKSGLAAYDGNSWQKISLFDGLCVTSVIVEGIGNIKAGIKGSSGGIAVFENNEWTFFTLANSEIPSGNINSMAADYEQTVWMATADKGILKLKNNSWLIAKDEFPLLPDDFTSIATAPDGSVWAGSSASQLTHLHDNTFSLLNMGTVGPVTSIIVTTDGSVWCGTSDAGLIKFDGYAWTSYTLDNASLPSNNILCIAKAPPASLLFSIAGGKVLMLKQ